MSRNRIVAPSNMQKPYWRIDRQDPDTGYWGIVIQAQPQQVSARLFAMGQIVILIVGTSYYYIKEVFRINEPAQNVGELTYFVWAEAIPDL